jgi:hypothetical protein
MTSPNSSYSYPFHLYISLGLRYWQEVNDFHHQGLGHHVALYPSFAVAQSVSPQPNILDLAASYLGKVEILFS